MDVDHEHRVIETDSFGISTVSALRLLQFVGEQTDGGSRTIVLMDTLEFTRFEQDRRGKVAFAFSFFDTAATGVIEAVIVSMFLFEICTEIGDKGLLTHFLETDDVGIGAGYFVSQFWETVCP